MREYEGRGSQGNGKDRRAGSNGGRMGPMENEWDGH